MSLDEACVNIETVSEVLLKARLSDHVTRPVQLLRISKWLQVTWKYSLYRSYRVYCRHENKCNEVEQRCHPSKRWSDGKPEIIQQNLLTLRTCMLPFQLFSYYWSWKLKLYYSGRELVTDIMTWIFMWFPIPHSSYFYPTFQGSPWQTKIQAKAINNLPDIFTETLRLNGASQHNY